MLPYPDLPDGPEAELARRILHRRYLKDNKLDRDGILVRLNAAANIANMLGDCEKEVRILMQIAKLQGYINVPDRV